MMRRPFYEVEKSVYLFPAKSQPDGDRNTPEELVRQWCLFELIRAYGICITDIEFEHPVRIGAKPCRIDILVLKDGKPWIVIECKEQKFKNHEKGKAQAVSYAGAQEIKAKFAVYTNGHVWHVQRYYREQWIPVPDIPILAEDQPQEPVGQLLKTLNDVAPLLYILHKPLEGNNAKRFWDRLQRFFHGWNSLTLDTSDASLHSGIEHVLRVFQVGKPDEKYCHAKLEIARAEFDSFRERKGYPYMIYPLNPEHVLPARMRDLHNGLTNMLKGTRQLPVYDSYLLRFGVAILEYGLVWASSKEPYPKIGTNVHTALYEYLSYAFAVKMNIELPDSLDDDAMIDMRANCVFAWESNA